MSLDVTPELIEGERGRRKLEFQLLFQFHRVCAANPKLVDLNVYRAPSH